MPIRRRKDMRKRISNRGSAAWEANLMQEKIKNIIREGGPAVSAMFNNADFQTRKRYINVIKDLKQQRPDLKITPSLISMCMKGKKR